MKGVLPDVVRLEDIIEAIHDIEEHNHKDISNKKTLQATLYCLTIIGEACSKLSTDLMDRYPEIPWKNIINLRNNPNFRIIICYRISTISNFSSTTSY